MPLDQDLIKRDFLGKDGFIWWIGQIPKESAYVENKTGRRDGADEINGPGERYKVRIFGYHEVECGQPTLTDEELPWATVMYPVTAGGGGGAASQSANLTQGTMVYGFFLDGNNAQQPVIMGCLGYNQTQFSPVPKDPIDDCTKGQPFDGYGPEDKVPVTHVREEPISVIEGEEVQTPSDKVGDPPGESQTVITTSPEIDTGGGKNAADKSAQSDKEGAASLKQTARCTKGDGMTGIFTDVKKTLKDIQEIQSKANGWVNYVNGIVDDEQKKIQDKIDKLTLKIARFVKSIINKVRGFTEKTIQEQAKNLYYLVQPNQTKTVKTAQDKVLELISCLFDKIISGLIGLIGGVLSNMMSKVVNTTECLIEGMMGNILGNVLGGTVAGIQSIVDTIQSTIGGIAGSLSGVVSSIIGAIENILAFGAAFPCQEDQSCPETEEWNLATGIEDANDLLAIGDNMSNLAKSVTDSVSGAAEAIQGAGAAIGAAGDDVANSVNNITSGITGALSQFGGGCDVGPVKCGPPQISVFGGGAGGGGATANAIISAGGELLAVELIDAGTGFLRSPDVKVQDPCGGGVGAVVDVIMTGEDDEDDGDGGRDDDPGDDEFDGDEGEDPRDDPEDDDGTRGSRGGSRRGRPRGRRTGGGSNRPGRGAGEKDTGDRSGGANGRYRDESGNVIKGTKGSPERRTGGDAAELNNRSFEVTSDPDDTGPYLVMRATPYRPNDGVFTLSWEVWPNYEAKESGGDKYTYRDEVEIVNDNFGLKDKFKTPHNELIGDIEITNFRQCKTFILTGATKTQQTTLTLRVCPAGQQGGGNKKIKKIIVKRPGFGFRSREDGSTGANGRLYSTPEQTLVIDPEGNFLPPISPGTFIKLLPGSIITSPGSVSGYGTVTDQDEDTDFDNGAGIVIPPGQPTRIENEITLTTVDPRKVPNKSGDNSIDSKPFDGSAKGDAKKSGPDSGDGDGRPSGYGTPDTDDTSNSSSDGKYNVRLCIEDVLIENGGVNYGPDDDIYLEPDHGAILKMETGPFGRITKVKVAKRGCGFTEMPKIRINSRTGFNADLIPLLEVQRVGEKNLQDIAISAIDSGIITVVDCVNQRYGRPDPAGSSADSGYYEKGQPNAAVRAID